MKHFLTIFCFLLIACPFEAFAGGAVAKQQYQKAAVQKQRQKIVQKQVQHTVQQQVVTPPVYQSEQTPQDTEALSNIYEELKITSEVWPLIVDVNPKEVIVNRYIKLYAKQGIYIRKPSVFYVKALDTMALKNKALFQNPFKDVLKFVAIMEYDFDNGKDKDALARAILGERLYQENKKRLGL